MFHRIGQCVVIVVLVAMLGGHWIILQTFAWSNMLADNLKTDSFASAVGRTFDGKHPCRLCKAIAKGRQSEKKRTAALELKKLEFVANDAAFFISAPQQFDLISSIPSPLTSLFRKPAVPPPKFSFC